MIGLGIACVIAGMLIAPHSGLGVIVVIGGIVLIFSGAERKTEMARAKHADAQRTTAAARPADVRVDST